MTQVSILIPVYNERENLPELYGELRAVLDPLALDLEILFVDDGSQDGSGEVLDGIASQDPRVVVLRLRRNFGQTAAMQAGYDHATGDMIVSLDADLQNDPADIPLMLETLRGGYDLVHGWRKNRQDPWLTRKLPSRIANRMISWVTRFPIHDLGCTLKAIRKELADELELCGEMHRFIPILAHRRGARCAEVVTHHRPRRHGSSKYGLSRIPRVVLDLVTVKFMVDYFASPMKFFGRLGLVSIGLAGLAFLTTLVMKGISSVDITGNPLFLLSAIAFLAGIQMFCMGILGEVNVRIYFEGAKRKPYAIRHIHRGGVGYPKLWDRGAA